MKRVEKALDIFNKGFNCAQSVLYAFSEDFGLNGNMALRIGGAFGSGIARMGNICGAVNGAFMVIGLKHAKLSPDDNKEKERAYKLARIFFEKFISRHSSIICKELLGYDMSKPEEFKIINERNLTSLLCPEFVQSAVEILEEILNK